MQIKFDIDGDVQLSRNLRLAVVKLSNMKEFHEDAIEIMDKRSDDLFKKKWRNVEKNPKWKPLASSTKKARANRTWYYKKTPNNPSVLRWTWNLQDNRTIKSNQNFGSMQFNAPYAVYHQRWGKNLPQRAIIDLDNNTNTKIIKALQKKVQKDLKVFWLQL